MRYVVHVGVLHDDWCVRYADRQGLRIARQRVQRVRRRTEVRHRERQVRLQRNLVSRRVLQRERDLRKIC